MQGVSKHSKTGAHLQNVPSARLEPGGQARFTEVGMQVVGKEWRGLGSEWR